MVILGIEFFALIVICYLFFVFVTRDHMTANKAKRIPGWVVGAMIMIPIAMIMLASWYVNLGLAK
jgi:cell division protein FtsW (lipid II flippase)